LARDFHENTKAPPLSRNYDPKPNYKIYPSAIALPIAKTDVHNDKDDGFIQTLLNRKSIREFSQENIGFEDLGRLLSLSFGFRHDNGNPPLRTYASAGARYPIEVYVAVLRSDDMEKGVYHFNVKDNSLELVKRGEFSDKLNSFYKNQDEVIPTGYPCLVLFSMVFNRTMQKYGERGYRFMLMDAGHMGQNLYLVATHLNLGVVALGAGSDNDDRIDNIIGLESSEENVFYSFALGVPQ